MHYPTSISGVRRPCRTRAGLTLLELTISMMVLLVAAGGIVSSLVRTRALARHSHERAVATLAIQDVIERMHAVPFNQVFARFNGTTADDPGGLLPSPGASFQVRSLVPSPEDGDGICGELLFGLDALTVRENVADPDLGLPRDLNLDGAIDNQDHATDYRLLPVRIRVRWTGISGNQQVESVHMFSELSD
jgi:type II secretory pathway pseudopilin PulG